MADGNEEVIFDSLGTTKILLNISDNSKDDILLIIIDMVKQSILNYCNIDSLPPALNFVHCKMASDVYRENFISNNVGQVAGSVSSISEGGRTVSFNNGSQLAVKIEDKVSNTKELNRYKSLYRL